MITYILTDGIKKKIAMDYSGCFLISNRWLSKEETSLVHRFKLQKLYLPQLDSQEAQEFYNELSKFWDELTKDFGPEHVFWRNGVSSKMQEWEKSISYFVLVLWTLKSMHKTKDFSLLIVCDSVEEIEVFSKWTAQKGFPFINTVSPVRLWFKRISQEFWNFLRFLYVIYVCCKKKSAIPRTALQKSKAIEAETLIISQFYSHSIRNGNYQDPFGQLYEFLLEKKQKFVILADLVDVPDRSIQEDMRACQSINLLYIYSLIGWPTIIKVSLKLLFRRFRIKRCLFDGYDVSALVRWHLRRFNYAFNLDAEIFFEAVKKARPYGQFKRMLIIFEGNVFERACIQAFRTISREGRVEGYSHAVIYPLNLKLHMTDQERKSKPRCDRYITCGNYASRLLKQMQYRPAEDIVSSCALRDIPIFKPEELQSAKKIVLVALDGFHSAVQQFDWLVENKDAFGDFHVVIRAHPNVPWEYILKKSIHAMPKEFGISQKSLKEDFVRSFCVVYRQASIGLQAILNGIPSIHMQIDLPLEGDPLYELNQFKWLVRNAKELKEALKQIKGLPVQEKEEARLQAIRFAEEYFSAVTEDRLKCFVG